MAQSLNPGLAQPECELIMTRIAVDDLPSDDRTCLICQDPYEDDGHHCVSFNCGHRFGYGCALTWLPRVPTCPLCRLRFSRVSVAREFPETQLNMPPHVHVGFDSVMANMDANDPALFDALLGTSVQPGEEGSIAEHDPRRLGRRELIRQLETFRDGLRQDLARADTSPPATSIEAALEAFRVMSVGVSQRLDAWYNRFNVGPAPEIEAVVEEEAPHQESHESDEGNDGDASDESDEANLIM